MISASALSAQFNPLPDGRDVFSSGAQVDAYAQLISDQGWANAINTSGWGSSPVSPTAFDPFGIMNVVFIGENAGPRNSLGIHWGLPPGPYGGRSTFGNTETLFEYVSAPASIASGHYVSINLDGNDTFDFWLNLEPSRSNLTPGIWSLFHPDINPSSGGTTGAGVEKLTIDGEDYFLFSYRESEEGSNDDTNTLAFFLHFSNPDETPFTPVPEPSVYGAFGALLLTGLIAWRRFPKKTGAQ